jgi:5-hydroxyisourate hydrolase-like protein (transthyretin family)
MDFDHLRAYASLTVIRGQVLTDHGGAGGEGSLPATVKLERRYKGSQTWEQIRTAATTQNATAPRFTFEVRTIANAVYRVKFEATEDHLASTNSTAVSAYRTISSTIKPRLLQMSGKVAPSYAGRRVFIERKTCAACEYVRIRTTVVNAYSNYKVTLAAPNRGRWFFRLAVPASPQFVTSYSGVVVTSRS